jgi:NAD(P)H-quinone oxidoreductase subunit 5
MKTATFIVLWATFSASILIGLLMAIGALPPALQIGTFIIIDSFSLIIGGFITLMALTITHFSARYMDGVVGTNRYYTNLLGVTAGSLLFVCASHVATLIIGWAFMGWFLTRLIGHIRGWEQARMAAKLTLYHFIPGALLLSLGAFILASQAQSLVLNDIFAALPTMSAEILWLAGLCIIAAAIFQSALIPAHRWLLSSMTAPTPVSALMHAGIINAGGILIAQFAPLFNAMPDLLLILFAAGAFSALLASVWMLAQPNVKQALGCSTVAQMGFMIMQCGLGLYVAALAHLILHGFYKAGQFLGAGSAVERFGILPQKSTDPAANSAAPSKIGAAFSAMTCGALGGVLFMILTHQPLTGIYDSRIVLTFFMVLTAMQAGWSVYHWASQNIAVRVGAGLALTGVGISLYAFIYMGLIDLFAGNFALYAPQAVSPLHFGIMALFGLFWVASLMQNGKPRLSDKLYVHALNAGQAAASTQTQRGSYQNAG